MNTAVLDDQDEHVDDSTQTRDPHPERHSRSPYRGRAGSAATGYSSWLCLVQSGNLRPIAVDRQSALNPHSIRCWWVHRTSATPIGQGLTSGFWVLLFSAKHLGDDMVAHANDCVRCCIFDVIPVLHGKPAESFQLYSSSRAIQALGGTQALVLLGAPCEAVPR